jgi:hypothetical protein
MSLIFQNIDPPPLRPASVNPPPLLGGTHAFVGAERGMGVNVLEDERHRIALLQ